VHTNINQNATMPEKGPKKQR